MTGNGIDDHLPSLAHFNVFIYEVIYWYVQVFGATVRLRFGYVDHKRATAISTCGAIYLRADESVEFMHHRVSLCLISFFQEVEEGFIFCFMPGSDGGDGTEICGDSIQMFRWINKQ